MKLYESKVSGNCYKVRLLLSHLGIPFERHEMSVVDRTNRPAVLGGLNPSLRFGSPQSGQYDIWVGAYGGGNASAQLVISEVSSQ